MQTGRLKAQMASSQQKSAYGKFKFSCYFNKISNLDQNTTNKLSGPVFRIQLRDFNHNFHQQKTSEKWNYFFFQADSVKVNTGQSWRWDSSLLSFYPSISFVCFHFTQLNFLKCYFIYSSSYENICLSTYRYAFRGKVNILQKNSTQNPQR